MLTFDVLTLFPNIIDNHFQELPYKKAQSIGVAKYKTTQLRDFGLDKRGTVDDRPYGGGVGMLLRIDPIYKALQSIYHEYYGKVFKSLVGRKSDIGDFEYINTPENDKIILLSPAGEQFNQEMAYEFARAEHLTLICGRYEGIDERVMELANITKVSVGNFVLSGGEIPALVIMEAVSRLLPGVLEKGEALEVETFTLGEKEYPQYTRPANFKGLKVPDILVSGHHKEIKKWQKENMLKI